MKFQPQEIAGVFLIEPSPFQDDRGVFRRHFCAEGFRKHGLPSIAVQANISENPHAFTLRGFHYQLPPHAEAKTLSCLRGKIHDIVVDVRPDSPTFMQWRAFDLDDVNRLSLHVPAGCANAFLTLVDHCLIQYYCSYPYTPAAERGIRYNDPAFGFTWPAEPRLISDKDRSHPDFQRPKV
ncbi:MAG TPA: dTDP-4-dehydrorhamnose 3,5-epimerase family protein [Gemmataceae bacterium]|nr:dTDP-4-dehydrorhamnose 3,5-epimerase family protein [Gemmataceae bacterium]